MPAPPEIRETDRCVRKPEVVGHAEAQAQRRADGSRRVAGEIAEDLPAEGQCSQPRIDEARRTRVVEHAFSCVRQECVGDHHLVEQTERHQPEAKAQLLPRSASRILELRHQLGRTHDRSGDQVREKRHEQGIIEEVARRQCATQIHIKRVRHCCEGVERNADWQHDVELRRRVVHANRARGCREVVQQEIAVLEVQQHAEVRNHRQQHPRAPRDRTLGFHQALRRVPVDHGRNPQQQDEWRVPGCVENVAEDQQIDLALFPRQRERVHQHDDQEERRKGQRVEYQALLLPIERQWRWPPGRMFSLLLWLSFSAGAHDRKLRNARQSGRGLARAEMALARFRRGASACSCRTAKPPGRRPPRQCDCARRAPD